MINTIDKLLKLPGELSGGLKDLETTLQSLQGKRPQEIVSSLVDTIGRAAFETKTPQATPVSAGKDAQGFNSGRVIDVVKETPDTMTIRIEKPAGFDYEAGQFINLRINVEGKNHYRSYTLSSAPHQDTLDVTVKRVEGGLISNYLCDTIYPGATLDFQGPAGKFHSAGITAGDTLLFISAGSGVTPLMAMLRKLDHEAATNPIRFSYSVRSPEDIIFAGELAELADRLPNLEIDLNFTRTDGPCAFRFETGRLDVAGLFGNLKQNGTLTTAKVFCCGPDDFMAAVKTAALASGIQPTNYYEESFGPAPQKKKAGAAKTASAITAAAGPSSSPQTVSPSGPAADKAGSVPDTGSSVQFAKSEVIVENIDGKTILEVAEENGVEVDFSCLGGFCGYCKVKKLSGDVTMELTEALTPEDIADDYILACNAKCNGRVVVDA